MDKGLFIKIAKDNFDYKSYRTLRKIKEDRDFYFSFKSMIFNKLDRDFSLLQRKISNLNLHKKDIFFAEIYFKLLESKFLDLKSNFEIDSLNRVLDLFYKVNKEVEINV